MRSFEDWNTVENMNEVAGMSEIARKALGDPYYAPLAESAPEMLVGAGFIDRPLAIDEKLNMLTLPLDAIDEASEHEVSVIYYTGCFAPIHEGHVTAMRIARETIEERTGENVVLGVFAPDHDSYVSTKPGAEEYHAEARLQRAYEVTEHESWMAVDSFPARYAPCDLNFTTLLARFENFLRFHVPGKRVKVYFLFGGDNAEFANAFTVRGHGVGVLRPGAEVNYSRILPEARVIFSEKVSTAHSSTEERARIAREEVARA